MYFPLELKHASEIEVTISVKKFFLAGSSGSAIVIAVLSQIPDFLMSHNFMIPLLVVYKNILSN